MRAHLVQLDTAWERVDENHERVLSLVDRADPSPGDLVLLPEMFATGFSANRAVTNDKRGVTLHFLCELARDHGVYVQAGRSFAACSVSPDCKSRNVMSVVSPEGRLMCEYSKRRLFPSELAFAEAGTDVVTWRWEHGGETLTVAPLICYDLRFPELFADGLRAGAEVFALGACWPRHRAAHWRALAIARAIECQAWVLAVNRVGADPGKPVADGWDYAGGSLVVSPTGEVVGELGDAAAVLSIEIPRAPLDQWRAAFPAWRSRL